MEKMIAAFPDLTAEIIDALNAVGRTDLVEQVNDALVDQVIFDDLVNAGYIYVQPSRPLNLVEQNVIRIRSRETVPVDCRYWVYLDVDKVGRLSEIEILNPRSLKEELKRRAGERRR